MDQSKNDTNPTNSGTPGTPTPPTTPVTPPTPATPTTPVTPTEPVATPAAASSASAVTPDSMPPVSEAPAAVSPPPAVDTDAPASGSSPVMKLIILAVALLLAIGALYAAFMYMNPQTGADSTDTMPTEETVPAEVLAPSEGDMPEATTNMPEEEQLQQIEVGTDESEMDTMQQDASQL